MTASCAGTVPPMYWNVSVMGSPLPCESAVLAEPEFATELVPPPEHAENIPRHKATVKDKAANFFIAFLSFIFIVWFSDGS